MRFFLPEVQSSTADELSIGMSSTDDVLTTTMMAFAAQLHQTAGSGDYHPRYLYHVTGCRLLPHMHLSPFRGNMQYLYTHKREPQFGRMLELKSRTNRDDTGDDLSWQYLAV